MLSLVERFCDFYSTGIIKTSNETNECCVSQDKILHKYLKPIQNHCILFRRKKKHFRESCLILNYAVQNFKHSSKLSYKMFPQYLSSIIQLLLYLFDKQTFLSTFLNEEVCNYYQLKYYVEEIRQKVLEAFICFCKIL